MCGRIVRILLFFCALCLGAHSGAARVRTVRPVRPVRPTAEGFYQKPSFMKEVHGSAVSASQELMEEITEELTGCRPEQA